MSVLQTGLTATPVVQGFRSLKSSRILLPLLTYKILFFLTVLIIFELFPRLAEGEYGEHRHWPLEGEPAFASRFATWDAAHYLYLAAEGYKSGDVACAFYPLWPGIIRAASFLAGGNVFITGLVLANLFSLCGFLLFHRFVKARHGERTADLATVLLLAFPGAIFFSFPYAESLFFLLIVLFFTFLFRDKYWGVALTGFLLALTKPIGIFCLVPLFWHFLAEKRPVRNVLAVYGPILGYGCYFLVMYHFTENAIEGADAQSIYPNDLCVANLIHVRGLLRALVGLGSFHGAGDSMLDRLFFVALLGSLIWIYRLNKPYFGYVFAAGVIPIVSAGFLSGTRNIMVCFPLFIVLADHLKGANRRLLVVVFALAGLQAFCLARYLNFMWAG